jgi:hypothetical protein
MSKLETTNTTNTTQNIVVVTELASLEPMNAEENSTQLL